MAQTKPLLVPLPLAATRIPPQGRDTPRPRGHRLSPRQTNGFGGFGQDSHEAGASSADLLPERTCCSPPVLWAGQRGNRPQATGLCTPPSKGRAAGLTPLSLLTPSAGGAQFGEESGGTGGAGCPAAWRSSPHGPRKSHGKLCSVHQQDKPTDSAEPCTSREGALSRVQCDRLVKPPRLRSTRAALLSLAAGKDSSSKDAERGCLSLARAFAREEQMCPWKR